MKKLPLLLISVLIALTVSANAVQVNLNPTQDAGIWAKYPGTNYGSSIDLWVGYDDGWADSLVEFDLSPYMGTIVESSYLELYVYYSWGTIPTDSWVDRVAGSWNESTVTWNNSPGYEGSLWFYIGTPTLGDWFRFEVTSIVETWIDSSFTNYGFYFADETSSYAGYYFYSKEYSDSNYHPKLELNYHDVSVQPTSLGNIKAIFK